jgi:GNAT superfamily N-acetyltransferase
MHAQHLGADLVWARRARLADEAESARSARQAARSRTADLSGPSPRPLRLTIRALNATDVDHLRALFERLSPRSRWLRYLAPVRSLTTSALRRLASIDHEVHEALGAFDEGELVGVAHYFRNRENPALAEISVEVADSHQRRGIGPRLLNELARLARERGICEFTATALRENAGVLAMVHNSAWPYVVRPSGSELDIVLTLPAAADGTVPAQTAPAHAVLTVCS